MPSFKTAVLALTAALFATVQADYVINPDSVSLGTRQSWCASEKSTCPIICEQTSPGNPIDNSCDPTTLTYGCVCADGLQPNISEYSLTLPYFTCQEWGNQCVTGCGQDSGCASSCRQDHPCGALNPTRANTSTSTTMSATTSNAAATSSGQIFDSFGAATTTAAAAGGAASTGKGTSFAPATFDVARVYTLMVVISGMFVGFGFMW